MQVVPRWHLILYGLPQLLAGDLLFGDLFLCPWRDLLLLKLFCSYLFFPSCFHKHFKTHMYHHISSFKITQPAACFTLVLQLLRGRIPVYTSHCPLLLDIVFKEHFRLLTSTGQSFQSDISIIIKPLIPCLSNLFQSRWKMRWVACYH